METNIQVIYVLGRIASSVSSDPGNSSCNGGSGECAPPVDLNSDGSGTNQAWVNWVASVAAHANGMDGLSSGCANGGNYRSCHAYIKYWEIWNEPDSTGFWTGSFSQLVRMAEDARCIIKGQGTVHNYITAGNTVDCSKTTYNYGYDPNAMMLTPSYHAPKTPLNMARNYLFCAGTGINESGKPSTDCNTAAPNAGWNAADIINFHMKPGNSMDSSNPYNAFLETTMASWVGKPSDCVTCSIEGMLGNNAGSSGTGGVTKPLWNDEAGFSANNWESPFDDSNGTMQGSYIARIYLYSASLTYVAATNWYDYNASKGGLGSTDANNAFMQVYSWMLGATYPVCSTSGATNQIYTCTFTLANGAAAEAIWDTSQSCTGASGSGTCTYSTQTVGSGWANSINLQGVSTPMIGTTLSVGIQPILLEK